MSHDAPARPATPAGAVASRLSSMVTVVGLAAISAIAAYTLTTLVALQTGNPYRISNVYHGGYGVGWNPENNFIQVVLFLVAMPVLTGALVVAHRRRPWIARLVAAVVGGGVIVANQVLAPLTGYTKTFDPFHYGEQLSPSAAFVDGATPFTQLYVLHGAGEDIWRPAIGYLLFSGGTPSVGSYLLITAIGRALAAAAFVALLAVLIRSTPVYLVAVLWFAASELNGASFAKNLVLYGVIALVLVAFRIRPAVRTRGAVFAGLGLLAGFGTLYSIDVGATAIAVVVGLGIAAVFVDWGADGLRLDRPRRVLLRWIPGIAGAAGLVVSQLVALVLLHPAPYREFVRLTFIEIPRYQGLTWDFPLPYVDGGQLPLWTAILLLGGEILVIGVLVISGWRGGRVFGPELGVAVVLVAISVITLRFAVGRPDLGHVIVSTIPVYLTAFYLVRPVVRRLGPLSTVGATSILVLASVLVAMAVPAQPWKVFVHGTKAVDEVRELKNAPLHPDRDWLTPSQNAVVDYLKGHTRAGDGLYVVPNMPDYYMLTGLRNPTRFSISWFSDPQQYTDEVLADLKRNPPEYIVLSSSEPGRNDSDGVPIVDRFPEVVAWIEKNYPDSVDVDGTEIVSR